MPGASEKSLDFSLASKLELSFGESEHKVEGWLDDTLTLYEQFSEQYNQICDKISCVN